MTEAAEFLPGLPAVRDKPVYVAFDGGRLTCYAGILCHLCPLSDGLTPPR
jgi:hypothetical protein